MVKFSIDGQLIEVSEGTTVLEAARTADIYIPTLCSHPDLIRLKDIHPADAVFQGEVKIENTLFTDERKRCGICIVEIEGVSVPVSSCIAEAKDGMVVITQSDEIKAKRQENLIPILARHRHACLTCSQKEGCSKSQCSSNVPEKERCCKQFGHCELQDIANYIGISDKTPKWIPENNLPIIENNPLFERDYSLCIGCTRCVQACTELRGVNALGFVYDNDGKIQVGYLNISPADSGCKFCTACVKVCPTGTLVYKSDYSRKKEDLVPCVKACPAHIDIPEYLRLIAEKRYDEANAKVREKVPFPGILGRVCVHPCEEVCNRGEVNKPVSICALKRYSADNEKGYWKKSSLQEKDTEKKIAIIGAGPAGLTIAFYLRKKGHFVTIFEARNKPGGMMRYGIPTYRLPEDILDKEIEEILSIGIEFKPNVIIGKDLTIDQLKSDGYDAVFIGIGAQKSKCIDIEGSDHHDVLLGTEFLFKIGEDKNITLKERVVVIGGGNVAIDVAMTAKRSGAKNITIVCLEQRKEMPAYSCEIDSALAENILLIPSWGPHKIDIKDNKITGIELIECFRVFDKNGEFNPQFNDTKKNIKTDQIIIAIGQEADLSFVRDIDKISVDKGLIIVNQETLETKKENVFAGGDAANTPDMAIIYAIAAGRKAASSIDIKLGGDGNIYESLFKCEKPSPFIGEDKEFAFKTRQKVPELDPLTRHRNFKEIYKGFNEEQAVFEAKRCLQCDLRLYMRCNPSPIENLLAFNDENINRLPETEGVFQLLDKNHNVLVIKGCNNLSKELLTQKEDKENAEWFEYEENKMYSQRESELIQKYLQEYGKMPGIGDDDIDDLF